MFDPSRLGTPQMSPADPASTWTGRVAIVGGCGHVGLPLGMAFARVGVAVDLVDLSADKVAMVNRGEMPFKEEGADDLLPELIESGLLRATTDGDAIGRAEAVIVTIGTPVGDFCDPSIGVFDRAMDGVLKKMHPGQLLALRSTVFPGVTERLGRRMAEAGLGGIDLAFAPERILQEKSLIELAVLPQIIGAPKLRAARRAADLFATISPKVIFTTTIEAELAKLFCNAFRYINFAVSNQFYMLAEQHEADFHRIQAAVKEDYPRMKAFAKPGFAAGPCLVKDTCQLGAFNHGAFPLGQAALEVNEGMPYQLILNLKKKYDLKGMTVGVLGMAMKTNNDDPRDSLSYKLRKVLMMECKEVLCTDPYVDDVRLTPFAEVVDRCDLLIVATPHDVYKDADYRQPVIDVTNTVKGGGRKHAGHEHPTRPHVHANGNGLLKASAS